MDSIVLQKTVQMLKDNNIERYTIWCNNSYIIEAGRDSTKVVFDDAKELIWIFRIPNNVMPNDTKPIAIEWISYEYVERICVSSDYLTIKTIAESAQLSLTEDLTKWLKKNCSQTNLYPIQSNPSYDKDGNPLLRGKMPTIK